MLAIINKVYQSLLAGEPVFLATQISKSGSAPRESGSKMIIYTDGSIFGSIGGGSMEQEVILTARSLFTLKKSMLKSYDSESISVGTPAPDMSCGGHIKVLIEYVPIDDNSIELYRYIHEALENGKSIELRESPCFGRKNASASLEKRWNTGSLKLMMMPPSRVWKAKG